MLFTLPHLATNNSIKDINCLYNFTQVTEPNFIQINFVLRVSDIITSSPSTMVPYYSEAGKQVCVNSCHLDLPCQLCLHNVVNVNHLKPYEPLILEEEVHISHPFNKIMDFQQLLEEDTLLDLCNCSTCQHLRKWGHFC